jgi:hypothetical protein
MTGTVQIACPYLSPLAQNGVKQPSITFWISLSPVKLCIYADNPCSGISKCIGASGFKYESSAPIVPDDGLVPHIVEAIRGYYGLRTHFNFNCGEIL